MRFQQINVEGFGTLSQCHIAGLTDGLNVIHGINGSGKTTLLHFMKGVLCGFEQAHRLRLLPPLKRGTPGGSLTLQTEQGRFEVIRHARADQSDTLALSLLEGTADDLATLRKTLHQIPEKRVSQLFVVSGYAAHDLAGLVRFAQEEGVDLSSRSNAGAWLSSRVRDMEFERAELFRTAPTQGTLVLLEQKREQLDRELATARNSQQSRLADWQIQLQTLRSRIESLTALRNRQDQELQAVQCDLVETQDRLWSRIEKVIQDVETIPRTAPVVNAEWIEKLRAIDQEIAHAQQVLRDLAGSRLTLSVSKADLVGSETPDLETVLQRQRQALSQIEARTEKLTTVLTRLEHASTCLCGSQSGQMQADVNSIREQVWIICQELGRQQAAHHQELLQNQREGVDRCEQELVRQIQRLRLHRDEILQHHSRTASDQIHFRTLHDSQGCLCHGHDAAQAAWTVPAQELATVSQVVVRERSIVTSAARPDDERLEEQLQEQRQELEKQLAEIVQKLHHARWELEQLECGAKEFASDLSVQTLQNEYVLVEQQLADAREQWQSLTLLQTVLQRTQQKLNAEAISPVIAEASRFLNQMTEGRYPRLRWNSAAEELLVVNRADGELPGQALSRGTLEQAVLSLRLALCREFQRRGEQLPLILDDVLTDSDEERSSAAADVLVEFAQTHQVLFLTCQEHLVNLFASRQATLFNVPGSPRLIHKPAPETQLTSKMAEKVLRNSPPSTPEQEKNGAVGIVEKDRVLPDEPYWLQSGSPINHVPSLGEQMSRRLGALGVRTVGELVDLDPETAEMPLDSLQISASTLRKWQAEARLLCCVPDLTGRDAQLLVVCGIQSPAELAECDVSTLLNQIAQIRSRHAGDYETQWLTQHSDWPSQAQVERWIRSGRMSRSWLAARNWTENRRIHVRHHMARTRARIHQSAEKTAVVHNSSFRLHTDTEGNVADKKWKYYLFLDSPIVDAPSIGPRMSQRLNAIGIEHVSQLLAQIPADIAHRLNRKEITVDMVRAWQQQAHLMCQVPQLRGHDAQVLVACHITNPEMLAATTPAKLFALVEPFVTSRDGLRLLRSSRVPDLAEVTDWIRWAQQAPAVRAA